MNDCLLENHGFEIHLMTFCERATQQLIKLDAFIVVNTILCIKHEHIHTVETSIDMLNNIIWPFTQNILKITGITSLKFGTPNRTLKYTDKINAILMYAVWMMYKSI